MLHHSVLEQLPARHLRQLKIGSHHGREYWRVYSSSSSIVLDALRQLTNLRALELESVHAERLLPAIPSLQQLTQLHLDQLTFRSVPELRNLPSIMQDLSFTVAPNYNGFQRKCLQPSLSHLTALTALTSTGEGLFPVHSTQILPPALQRLVINDCPSAKPLCALQDLRVLHMVASTTPAGELQLLGRCLPHLSEVVLGYDRDAEVIKVASAGWSKLPVKALDLKVYPGPVMADTVQQLSHLLGLTMLTIAGYDVALDCTASQLGKVLVQLTALKELKLAYIRMREEGAAASGDAGAAAGTADDLAAATAGLDQAAMQQAAMQGPTLGGFLGITGSRRDWAMGRLMRCIARLPQLQSLSISRLTLGCAAVELAAAASLTCLRLQECEICDVVVAAMSVGLKRLQKLNLSCNIQVTPAIVPVISREWQHLTELALWSTKVPPADVEDLRLLLPSLKVVVV
eukprot:gene1043-1381_t